MTEWIGPIGAIMLVVGLLTALIDMGMNGARYAGWAPWGFGMSAVGLIIVEIVGRHP